MPTIKQIVEERKSIMEWEIERSSKTASLNSEVDWDKVKSFHSQSMSAIVEGVKELIEKYQPVDDDAEQENSGAYEYHARREMAKNLLASLSVDSQTKE